MMTGSISAWPSNGGATNSVNYRKAFGRAALGLSREASLGIRTKTALPSALLTLLLAAYPPLGPRYMLSEGLAVALSSEQVAGAGDSARATMVSPFSLAGLAVVGLGLFVARRICTRSFSARVLDPDTVELGRVGSVLTR
jgi:hypothetical protein